MKVAVYGASSSSLAQVYYDEAYKLGAELAKRGHTMVFGGGTSGLMGAAARGVHSVGGSMIGVAPHFFNEPGILYDGCTEMLFTETMGERKKLMEDMSDAFITLPGGIGTFEEFFEALTLKQLGRHAKCMMIYNINNYYDELDAMMRRAVSEEFLSQEGYELYRSFSDITALFDYLDSYKPELKDLWKDKIFR